MLCLIPTLEAQKSVAPLHFYQKGACQRQVFFVTCYQKVKLNLVYSNNIQVSNNIHISYKTNPRYKSISTCKSSTSFPTNSLVIPLTSNLLIAGLFTYIISNQFYSRFFTITAAIRGASSNTLQFDVHYFGFVHK